MDPDKAVAELCRLSTEIGHETDPTRIAALAEEMAATWDGLDAWLSNGGFFPTRWRQVPTP